MAVKIVTDSASDIPAELAEELGISVVPCTVFFGAEAFKDGVEITKEEFFHRLTTGNVMPTTTQPSVGRLPGRLQAACGGGTRYRFGARLRQTERDGQLGAARCPGTA